MTPKEQSPLFEPELTLPPGLLFRPNFITEDEEAAYLGLFKELPLERVQFKEYQTKRRALDFGWDYDYEKEKLIPGPPLPDFLRPLQIKIGKWLDIKKWSVAQALLQEYPRGSAIGWHRDREKFGMIIGVSFGGTCRMRWRPLSQIGNPKAVVSLPLPPRSAYVMARDIRWRWQHSIPAVPELRYSITFRTIPQSEPLDY
jgi:alkylated DNA repair dioxygenase AlkB